VALHRGCCRGGWRHFSWAAKRKAVTARGHGDDNAYTADAADSIGYGLHKGRNSTDGGVRWLEISRPPAAKCGPRTKRPQPLKRSGPVSGGCTRRDTRPGRWGRCQRAPQRRLFHFRRKPERAGVPLSWGCDLMPSGSFDGGTTDLGDCRPGNPSRSRAVGTQPPEVAVPRLRPLAEYRAAKTRAAKSVMAVIIGAILAFGGLYVGWKLGSR
jgi:hypothetical protein